MASMPEGMIDAGFMKILPVVFVLSAGALLPAIQLGDTRAGTGVRQSGFPEWAVHDLHASSAGLALCRLCQTES